MATAQVAATVHHRHLWPLVAGAPGSTRMRGSRQGALWFQHSSCDQLSETIATRHGAYVGRKVAVNTLPHGVLLHLQLPQQVLQAGTSRSQGVSEGDCLNAGFM